MSLRTIAMICPSCDRAQIARRATIDPPAARIVFFPCCRGCAQRSRLQDVVYTDARRNPIQWLEGA